MARRGMGLDSVVRAKILTSGISLSFVLWWWSKQPSPAQPSPKSWWKVEESTFVATLQDIYELVPIYRNLLYQG